MGSVKDLRVNLESKILSCKKVVIVPHNRIDFDAFASAIGISLIADKLKKHSVIVMDDPAYNIDSSIKNVIDGARNKYHIINKEKYLSEKNNDDLIILTDTNKSNLICLEEEIKKIDSNNIVVIDHHDKGEKTVKTNNIYIDCKSSSASEIIVKLLNSFKIKLTPEAANYLLAGIHLDTNRLTKNTTSDTFKIIAKLMENGANNAMIDEWFKKDFESDKKVSELFSKANIYKYSFAIVLAEETCIYTQEELAKVSDKLLKYGVDAAFAIGKVEENLISISARAKERVNVGKVMDALGGGGNKHSAATKITNESIEEVGKKLVKLIKPPHII